MLTFRHAGDIGDLIYFMPIMRALGGGLLYIEAAGYTRVSLTPDKWCGLDLLLKQQPYVSEVLPWQKQIANYNGNDFRARLFHALGRGQGREKHLCHWMCDSHGLPYTVMDAPWLEVEPIKVAKVVFSRSGPGREPRYTYHNPTFPWWKVWKKYGKQAVFVGTPFEYEIFRGTCGEVPHYPTETLLDAARVIAGCELFVGNQSAPNAIAQGLKKRILLEVWPSGANCSPTYPGCVLGTDQNVQLPDL